MTLNVFDRHEKAQIQLLLEEAAMPTSKWVEAHRTDVRYFDMRLKIEEKARSIISGDNHTYIDAHKVLKELRSAKLIGDSKTNTIVDADVAFDWLLLNDYLRSEVKNRKQQFIDDVQKVNLNVGRITPVSSSQIVKNYILPKTKIQAREELVIPIANLIQRIIDFKNTPPFSFINDDGKICLLSSGFEEGDERKIFYRKSPKKSADACVWRELLWAYEALQGQRELCPKQKKKVWNQYCKLSPYLNDLEKPLDQFRSSAFSARATAPETSRFTFTVLRYRKEIELTLWALCNNQLVKQENSPNIVCDHTNAETAYISIGRKALGFLVCLIWMMYNQVKLAKPDLYFRTRIEILCTKQFYEQQFPGITIFLNHEDNRVRECVESDKVKGFEFREFCLDILQAADELSLAESTRDEKLDLFSNTSIWRSESETLEQQIPLALRQRLGFDDGEPCPYGIHGFYDEIPYLRVC